MSRVELERVCCPVCGKWVTVTWNGGLRVHGVRSDHCPGSGRQMSTALFPHTGDTK